MPDFQKNPEVVISPASGAIVSPIASRLEKVQWWLLAVILAGLTALYFILTDAQMTRVFFAVAGYVPFDPTQPDSTGALTLLSRGIGITLRTALSAYLLAVTIGLLVGLARVSSNPIINNLASLYVEIIRGVPILVLLLYIAFVVVPIVAGAFGLSTRDFPNEIRVIVGLGIAYGAFESEIFRAGIQSIERGQMEAARALGMNYIQAMRHVILPQAIRRVLPALGNDFIAMLKDSSLVSVIGVQEILWKAQAAGRPTYQSMQTLIVAALVYWAMTLVFSYFQGRLEKRQAVGDRAQGPR